MIRFVDLQTGKLFDGAQPYTFWMEKDNGVMSTGLNYVQKICLLSDNSAIKVKMASTSADPVFYALDDVDATTTSLHDTSFIDLSSIKKKETQFFRGTSYPIHVNNGVYRCYMFVIYILADASYNTSPGEYRSTFDITEGVYMLDYVMEMGTTTFNIGANFYSENEVLKKNLENKGIEIPDDIQKAIYTASAYEEMTDNALLNRKWKELLQNYLAIDGTKGSYNSLINSLNWFEYGDLIALREFWKREDPYGRTLLMEELQSKLGGKLRERLKTISKTTYIGVYTPLQKLSVNSDGETLYEDTDWNAHTDVVNDLVGEANPVLQNAAFGCTVKELTLKLANLQMFFQTYFMPIHLDLIHSTVENIVYMNTIKTFSGGERQTRNAVGCSFGKQSFSCSLKDDSTFYFKPTTGTVYYDTLFNDDGTGTLYSVEEADDGTFSNPTLSYMNTRLSKNVCGITLDSEVGKLPVTSQGYAQRQALVNRFRTITCPITVDVTLPVDLEDSDSGSNDDFVVSETLSWVRHDDGLHYYVTSQVPVEKSSFSFTIALPFKGTYDVTITFKTASGQCYTKTFKSIYARYDVTPDLTVYKITRRDLLSSSYDDDATGSKSGFATMWDEDGTLSQDAFTQIPRWYTDPTDNWTAPVTVKLSTQYVKTDATMGSGVGVSTNHTLVLDVTADDNKFILSNGSTGGFIVGASTDISELINVFPLYWWMVIDRTSGEDVTSETDPLDDGQHKFVVGISRTFRDTDADADNKIKISKNPGYTGEYKNNSYVDEYRFYPIFFKIDKLDDDVVYVSQDDALCVIPSVDISFDDLKRCTWKFVNKSTGVTTKSGVHMGTRNPYISAYDEMWLGAGFYSIYFIYKPLDDEVVTDITEPWVFVTNDNDETMLTFNNRGDDSGSDSGDNGVFFVTNNKKSVNADTYVMARLDSAFVVKK